MISEKQQQKCFVKKLDSRLALKAFANLGDQHMRLMPPISPALAG
jgi:hypothetical protein